MVQAIIQVMRLEIDLGMGQGLGLGTGMAQQVTDLGITEQQGTARAKAWGEVMRTGLGTQLESAQGVAPSLKSIAS